MSNDERLAARRTQLKGRLLMAGVYLMISEVLSAAALIGALFDFPWIVMPYEFFIPYYAVMLVKRYAFADGAVRPGLIFLGALAAIGFMAFYLVAFFMIKKSRSWANLTLACYIIDTAALIVISGVSFETVVMSILWNLINIGLHIYVLIGLARARNAWKALGILPEKEIDDGDPYAEFRRKDDSAGETTADGDSERPSDNGGENE